MRQERNYLFNYSGLELLAESLCDSGPEGGSVGEPTGDVSWYCHASGNERNRRSFCVGGKIL